MKLQLQISGVIALFLLLNEYCKKIGADSRERRKRSTDIKGVVTRSCQQCGLLGLKRNGYCTLYDNRFQRFPAYCDMTSEPGYAWTLVASFSRDIAVTEMSQIFKTKTFGENAPVNENLPNWDVFRFSKERMHSISEASTHVRFTCSENGPFVKLNNYIDYARVKLSVLTPLMVSNTTRGRCVDTEFVNIRDIACNNCSVWFDQQQNRRTLHIDSYQSQSKCSYAGIVAGAINMEDNFGFYGHYNTKFSCTKQGKSTTQIWFGRILLPSTSRN